jgi:sugar lactone lactonase YvrE
VAVAVPALAAGPKKLPHVTPYSPTGQYAEGALQVNGRLVDPAGRRTLLGDFPLGLVVSPDGRTGVVANGGQGEGGPQQGDQSLQVVDLASGKVVQMVRDHLPNTPTFYSGGLAFSSDGKHLYATGGGNDTVYDYAVKGQKLSLAHRWKSSLKAGAPTVAGGLAGGGVPNSAPEVGDVGAYSRDVAFSDGTLYVSNEQGSTVAALSASDGTVKWESTIGGAGQVGGAFLEDVQVVGSTVLVAAQGLNLVAALDASTGAVKGLANVGDHPVAIGVAKDGKTAYVANANDDSLSVLDLSATSPSQVGQISTHLIGGEANGSTPDAVVVDDKAKRVYVGLAGDNAVLAYTTGPTPHLLGAVATGNYPTGVAIARGHLYAVSAKGYGGVPVTSRKQYDGNDMVGLLNDVALPTAKELATGLTHSRALLLNSLGTKRPADSPIPDEAHKGQSPIKHVVMVVRENRTFDQVFGDLERKGADVEPKYLEFGAKDAKGRTVTPNAHAIASRFGLSQNFYSDGEASIQGHYWTADGVSTDYTEKSWLDYYSNRNHSYDPTAPVVYPRCGAMWQQLAAQGKTFRNYGELIGVATSQTPTVTTAPNSGCSTPGGTYDAASAAGLDNGLGANLSLTTVSDVDKEAMWEREYTPLIAAGQMPQFSYVVMGNDHTDGTSAGKKTPQAHVATNDLAVGKLVDFLSHSAAWKDTLVVVVEDDSQDGLDHRDGHRNIALMASPYIKPGALSSVHISQASVLHTVELVLGLQPISSYTQYAAVPYDLFSSKPDLRPYTAITPTYPMDAKNGAAPTGSAAALPVDTSRIDVAGPLLEAQLWQATRPGVPMPAALLHELATRAGISSAALAAWAQGKVCTCTNAQLRGVIDP